MLPEIRKGDLPVSRTFVRFCDGFHQETTLSLGEVRLRPFGTHLRQEIRQGEMLIPIELFCKTTGIDANRSIRIELDILASEHLAQLPVRIASVDDEDLVSSCQGGSDQVVCHEAFSASRYSGDDPVGGDIAVEE